MGESKLRFIAMEINLISKMTFGNIVLMTFREILPRRNLVTEYSISKAMLK